MTSARSRLRRPLGGFLLGAVSAVLIVTSFTGASLVLLRTSMGAGSGFTGHLDLSRNPAGLAPGPDGFASRRAFIG